MVYFSLFLLWVFISIFPFLPIASSSPPFLSFLSNFVFVWRSNWHDQYNIAASFALQPSDHTHPRQHLSDRISSQFDLGFPSSYQVCLAWSPLCPFRFLTFRSLCFCFQQWSCPLKFWSSLLSGGRLCWFNQIVH